MGWLIDQKVNYASTYAPNINKHQPFEQFQYSPQIDYSYSPSIAYESPGATVTCATVTTKKEMTTSQQGGDTSGADVPIDQSEETANDPLGNIILIGGLAVVGIVAYGIFKRKKSM